ncbi:MAG: L-alanine-DL-glutamate epimerase-like enolase superfamily enzyme [Paraglaciecola sp.]|jgi:L-alanine-DL-glutamate epimerase-like enolase superfamily enzyme
MGAIRQVYLPLLKGRDVEQLSQLTYLVHGAMQGNYSAKAAVEIALYDLWGKFHRAPLYKLLGGDEPTLRTDLTISVSELDKMLADCERAITAGFDVLKIKVGKNINQDITRIIAIYRHVGGRASLRLDVNQGWSAKQTVLAARQLESQGVELELIEQPVRADDLNAMRYVTQHITTAVMADESAFSPKQVIELITTGAADIINIKLMKSGGLSTAIHIADIASTYHIPCMMGCMLEGNVGVTAAAHLGVAKNTAISLIDLDGPALGQYDPVVGGACFEQANIRLSPGDGLGIESIDGLTDWV